MNKLEALKKELEGRIEYLTARIDSGDFGSHRVGGNSTALLEYFVCRRRAFLQVLEYIDLLEKM